MFVTDFKLNGKFSFRLYLQEHQTHDEVVVVVGATAAAEVKTLIPVFYSHCVEFNLFVIIFSNISFFSVLQKVNCKLTLVD